MTESHYTATIRVSPYATALIYAACRHMDSNLQQALAFVLASRKADLNENPEVALPSEISEGEI